MHDAVAEAVVLAVVDAAVVNVMSFTFPEVDPGVTETDIRRVRTGQRATIRSAALEEELEGTVRHIRQKVEKQDEIGTDPAARKDARIIEVAIELDDSTAASRLTNLQVDVLIHL